MSMISADLRRLEPHIRDIYHSEIPTSSVAVSVDRPNGPFHLGRLLNMLNNLSPDLTASMMGVDCSLSHMCQPTVVYSFSSVHQCQSVYDILRATPDMHVEFVTSPTSNARFLKAPIKNMSKIVAEEYYSNYGSVLGVTMLPDGRHMIIEFDHFRDAFHARVDEDVGSPSVTGPPSFPPLQHDLLPTRAFSSEDLAAAPRLNHAMSTPAFLRQATPQNKGLRSLPENLEPLDLYATPEIPAALSDPALAGIVNPMLPPGLVEPSGYPTSSPGTGGIADHLFRHANSLPTQRPPPPAYPKPHDPWNNWKQNPSPIGSKRNSKENPKVEKTGSKTPSDVNDQKEKRNGLEKPSPKKKEKPNPKEKTPEQKRGERVEILGRARSASSNQDTQPGSRDLSMTGSQMSNSVVGNVDAHKGFHQSSSLPDVSTIDVDWSSAVPKANSSDLQAAQRAGSNAARKAMPIPDARKQQFAVRQYTHSYFENILTSVKNDLQFFVVLTLKYFSS